jgi:L-alanine-DL-glutamate epimerase-like enolase superfamily enzyme
MRITDVKNTIVSVPFCKDYPWRIGLSRGITVVLAEVTTEDGLTGIGESPCLFPPAEATKGVMDAAAAFFIDEDPFDHERIYKRILGLNGLYYDRVFAGLALSGLDLALWDLMGKITRKPLYKLIGGRIHPYARFICIVPVASPEVMAQNARKVVDEGCETIYVKYDGDEQELFDRLDAIRKAVGAKPKLRVDFNQGLSSGFAVKFIQELEQFNLEAVEQPCAEDDLDGMRYVRQSVATPVISDESSKTFHGAYRTIKAEAADIIEIDPYTTDGVWGVRKACGMAEAANLPVVFHSVGELGINQTKLVHLAVSTPNATLDHQTVYDYDGDDVIVGGRLPFERWTMRPADRPGLGLELDPAKVARYSEYYRTHGGMYMGAYNTQAYRGDLERYKSKVPLIAGRASTMAFSRRLPGEH